MLFQLLLMGCLDIISFQLKTCGVDQTLYQGQCIQNSCYEIYIKRFQETTYESTFIGMTQISFDINVGVDSNGDSIIIISFTDNIDGTTNLDNSISCITPVHSTYTINHASKVMDTKPIINSKLNNEAGKRQWQYTIRQSTYNSTLIQAMKNNTHLNYFAFYGIDFNILNYTQITFLYSFQVTVAIQGSSISNTLLYYLLTHQNKLECQTYNPQINCISNNSTELYFCTSSNCDSPSISITLASKQTFWLYMNISEPFYQSYLLIKPIIEIFSGEQLIKVINPVQTNVNISAGLTIIGLIFDFEYENINVIVSTLLCPPSLTDLNVSNTVSMRMFASSSQISCNKNSTGQCILTSTTPQTLCPNGTFFNGNYCESNLSCDTNYLSRFQSEGNYSINFNPQVSFNKNGLVVATVSFDDLETDGLIKTDNNYSCIVAEHFLYNENFESQQGKFYPNITSVYVNLTNKRYWVFNLPFLKSNDSDRLIYYGYYGIDFNFQNGTLAQLQFSFQAAYSNSEQGFVISNFNQFLNYAQRFSEATKQIVFIFALILGI